MKFKEFAKWCNERAADGKWGYNEARICTHVCETIYAMPFWKREKAWLNEKAYCEMIVEKTNEIITRRMQDEI